ncbi:hypothetical protein EV1_033523 [Malus domestica]
MGFGGDMIKFNIFDSVKNPNDVRSCFAIDVIKNLGQEHSTAPIKKDVSRTTIEEGIGAEHKEQATTLKIPNMAESTLSEFVDSAATFELLPSLVQVPNRIQVGRRVCIDFRKFNTTITKDHYPLPFIDPMHESFEEHVVEAIPLHAVGSNEA